MKTRLDRYSPMLQYGPHCCDLPVLNTLQATPTEILPHVYMSASSAAQGNVLSEQGKKYMLPLGTIYLEEVSLPYALSRFLHAYIGRIPRSRGASGAYNSATSF